jgi:hypothetical protein
MPKCSAGFTYRIDYRLKPRASKFRELPAKLYNIFNTVIGLSHLCCHNVGIKTRRRKTGRANFDSFLDITFLLLKLFF